MYTQLVISRITEIYDIFDLFFIRFWGTREGVWKVKESHRKRETDSTILPEMFGWAWRLCQWGLHLIQSLQSVNCIHIKQKSMWCLVLYCISYIFGFKVWIADTCTVHLYFDFIHKYCSHVYFGNSVGRTEKEENKWARIMRKV